MQIIYFLTWKITTNRSIMLKPHNIVDLIEPRNLLWHDICGIFQMIFITNRPHIANLTILLVRIYDWDIRRWVFRVKLRWREFRLKSLCKCANSLILEASVDELFVLNWRIFIKFLIKCNFNFSYPHKQRKAFAKKANTEIFWLGSNLS